MSFIYRPVVYQEIIQVLETKNLGSHNVCAFCLVVILVIKLTRWEAQQVWFYVEQTVTVSIVSFYV